MTEQKQAPADTDAFAALVDRTKKTLKKHPNMGVADFVNGFLFPLLDEVRNEIAETQDSVHDLWDYIGEIPEEPLLDDVQQAILVLAGYLDMVLVRTGWLSAGGPTDSFPADMREQFVAIGKRLAEVQERIDNARLLAESGEDEDEDEDEDDEEGEEASSPEETPTSPVETNTKPVEA